MNILKFIPILSLTAAIAADTAPVSPAPTNRVAAEALQQSICGVPWSWNGSDDLTLNKDGTGSQTHSQFGWTVSAPRTITLVRADRAHAVLTFDEGFSWYTGIDFEGNRNLWGHRRKPALPESGIRTVDDLRHLLTGTVWSYNRTGGHLATEIAFRSEKVANMTANWQFPLTVIDERTIEIRHDRLEPARLVFAPDYASFTGTDFGGSTPVTGEYVGPASAGKPHEAPIERIEEFLEAIPPEIVPADGTHWTDVQRDAANKAFAELFGRGRRVHLRVVVSEIAHWPGLTLCSVAKIGERYPVRFFGHFSEDWVPKLASFSVGETIIVDGEFTEATYGNLWGSFSLSISADNCSATKAVLPTPAAKGEMPSSPVAQKSVPPPPGQQNNRHIVLNREWNGTFQVGNLTQKDLAMLFTGHGTPRQNVEGDPSIMVFEGVPFLTPIEEAKDRLKITGKLPSKNGVNCPGLPRDSLSYYAFDGRFEGNYNRLYLVTDSADQVVCAQLVDETPHRSNVAADRWHFHTYNFVNYRTKAAEHLIIRHEVSSAKTSPSLLVVDSELIDPGLQQAAATATGSSRLVPTTRATGRGNDPAAQPRVLEVSRWYVPQPLVDLILTCVTRR